MTGRDGEPGFVRAAHYFGDGWPLDSLMVMRQPQLRRDLRRLRRLGFNTIIVVVPWQGVQTSHEPPEYDGFYLAQLRLVLAEAQRQGLAVLLRVSYVHQVMPAPTIGSIRVAQALLTQAAAFDAWLDYHRTLHGIAAAAANCVGMFVSWEELWHAFRYWQLRDEETRRRLAIETGFTAYLARNGVAGLDVIPERSSPAHRHYHHFVNERITACFEAARRVNPMLGVEYRVDRDPVEEGGTTQWLDNARFLDWEPRRYSYWAPFMGARNEGEALDAQEALTSLETMLDDTGDQGRCLGQVIEQFNFIDDTRQYVGTHAEIAPDQIAPFLDAAAPLLAARSGGYGLWAARDYRCNVLYNAAFLADLRGWELAAARPSRRGVSLERGGRVVQRIKPGIPWVPRMHPFESITLEADCGFLASLAARGLRARLNGGPWTVLQRRGAGVLGAELPVDFDTIRTRGLHFEIENQGGPVELRRLQLYHLVYRVGVTEPRGRPGPHARAIRRFNRLLAGRRPGPSRAAS